MTSCVKIRQRLEFSAFVSYCSVGILTPNLEIGSYIFQLSILPIEQFQTFQNAFFLVNELCPILQLKFLFRQVLIHAQA